jgi:hypothetical protein
MKPVTFATIDPTYLDLLRALPEVRRELAPSADLVTEVPVHQALCLTEPRGPTEQELERVAYISRRVEATARRREAMLCQTPEVIQLPPRPCTERLAMEEQVPPKMTVPVPGLMTTSDGRIGPELILEESEARRLVELEEDLYTKDLKVAEERLLEHDWEYNRWYLNSSLDAYRTKSRGLYLQDSGMKLATWIKISALELGISAGDFYKRLATGEAIDRFMVTTILGQWGLTLDQIVERAARLSYILTAFYRHVEFKDMKGPFLEWPFDKYVAFMTGRKLKSTAERDAERAAKYEKEQANPPVLTATDPEKEIVSLIKKGLDVKILGLSDPSHVQYLEKAQLAYRRELSDMKLRNLKPVYYGTGSICKDLTTIHTLTDAKFLFRQHMAEGIPHKLIRNCLCARIEDDPELVAQRMALDYKTAHAYLLQELKVDFNPCRAITIGRIYLRNEDTILRLMGNIDSEVKLSKLLNFEKAIENHGDQPELIVRFLGPDVSVADWDAFALHRDYEQYLSEKRMTQAKIKEARRILFEYHARKLPPTQREREAGIVGESVHVFAIVLEEEKSFLDRCLRDPAYLNSYVQKYAWYRDHGYLP